MTLEDIVALEEIKKIKALYCYYLDMKQFDDYANLLSEDVTVDCDTAVSTRQEDPKPVP